MMMINTKLGVALLAFFASTASAANNNNENNKKRHLRKGRNNRRTVRQDKTMDSILANDITEDVAFWTRSLQSSIPPVVRPPTPNPTMPGVPVPAPTPFPTPFPTPRPQAAQTNPPTDTVTDPPIITGTPTYSPTVSDPVVTSGTPTYSPSESTTTEPPAPFPPSNTPVARDDSANVGGGGDLAFVSVLVNDTPATGQQLNVRSIVTQATNGDCSISLDLLEVVYVPNDGFTGQDSCVYEACDGVPECDTATLEITVG